MRNLGKQPLHLGFTRIPGQGLARFDLVPSPTHRIGPLWLLALIGQVFKELVQRRQPPVNRRGYQPLGQLVLHEAVHVFAGDVAGCFANQLAEQPQIMHVVFGRGAMGIP